MQQRHDRGYADLVKGTFRAVMEQVAVACRRVGRCPADVKIVAVSKGLPVEKVREAVQAGITVLGENRSRELRQKARVLGTGIEWHFIGHLQSNKVKRVLPIADLIHSVDRVSLAREIDGRAVQLGSPAPVLVQVNVSGEESKQGIAPAELKDFVHYLSQLKGIRVTGLMTMAPFVEEAEEVRWVFRRLREMAGDMARQGIPGISMKELSMGMSNDYQVAVEEGATLVRVGRAIFAPETPA